MKRMCEAGKMLRGEEEDPPCLGLTLVKARSERTTKGIKFWIEINHKLGMGTQLEGVSVSTLLAQ